MISLPRESPGRFLRVFLVGLLIFSLPLMVYATDFPQDATDTLTLSSSGQSADQHSKTETLTLSTSVKDADQHSNTDTLTLNGGVHDDVTVIAWADSDGGSIVPNGTLEYSRGDNQNFTISPKPYWAIDYVLIDGVDYGAISWVYLGNMTMDHSIEAYFEPGPALHTLTVQAPSGDGTCNITTGVHYYVNTTTVNALAINGVFGVFQYWVIDSVQNSSNPISLNMASDHVLQAIFESPTFTVTATAGAGGHVSPSGVTVVDYLDDLNVTVTPNEGYYIGSVIVDGSPMGAVSWVYFSSISSNHILTATFYPEGFEPYPSYQVYLRRFENGTVWNSSYTATIQTIDGIIHLASITGDNQTVDYGYQIYAFTYPIQDGASRTIFYPVSPIIPVAPGELSDTYQFFIKDLTGYLNGKTTLLEAWRNVNGTDRVVESGIVNNPINGVPLTLTRYQLVRMKLRLDDNVTRYDFGDFMPTGDNLIVYLVFNYRDFNQTINQITSYLSASAIRSEDYETVSVAYLNNLTGYDFSAQFRLVQRNGALIGTFNSTSNSDDHDFSSLTNTTDYVVTAEFTHSYWPEHTIKKAWVLPGAWETGAPVDFPSFEDMGWTFGGVTQIIPISIVLCVAGIFSYVSAPIGIILTIMVAGAMNRIGVMTIPQGMLALAFSLGVIMAIGRRNK